MPQDAKKVERLINILADFFMSIRKEAMATAEGAIDEVPPGPHPWRCAMPTQSATHVGNTLSREKLWRQLYWTLVSPRFHTLFLRMRLRVHFVSAPWYRRVLSGGYAVVVGVGLAYTGAWLPWVVAWLIPIFPLYHVAALLQFVSEHRWLQGYQPTP